MAVQTWIYGKPDIRYEGCVLDTYERNGYNDSDWYAVCGDREQQEIVTVEYDTTRCGAGGRAEIDATEDVLREVYRHHKRNAASYFDSVYNEKLAKTVKVGDTIKVVRGRKVPKGTVGKVFWIGSSYNYYSRDTEERVGIEKEDGSKAFLPLEYVNVIGWENRLIHGKSRKRMIRNNAINSMPAHYRSLFINSLREAMV